jgi:hypothetical protein
MADTTLVLAYPTGANLYTQVVAPDNTVWNGSAYVSFVVASWSTYATSTPETPASSGVYMCQFPIASPAGNYKWRMYLRAGASPASTDVVVGTGQSYWDGSTFGGTSSVTSGVPANVIQSGTARGGTINTITLALSASSVDNTYQMNQIYLSGGTGAGQTGVIVYGGYVGSTRVATVSANWATIPDNTTSYQIIPQGAVVVGAIGGAARTVTQDYLGATGGVANLKVVSAATGNPIAGATVNAYLASAFAVSGPGAPVSATTTTDANGNWSLSLPPSTYTVTFTFANESAQSTFTVT